MRMLFCPVCGEGQMRLSQKSRCMNCNRMVNMAEYIPTKQEIAEKCLEIQEGWTAKERENRNNYPYQPVYIDATTYHIKGHVGRAYSTICCKD